MIAFEKALEIVISRAVPVEYETVRLDEALGRYTAQDIAACCDMPPFDKSAVDGYACLREDILEMTVSHGLRLQEVIPAGRNPEKAVSKGFCSKIMTGAPLPMGAEVVLMVEQCSGEDIVCLKTDSEPVEKLAAKSNICLRGEDVKKGEILLRKGTKIGSQEIAVIAACGLSEVKVYSGIKVGVISTGSELVEPGSCSDGRGNISLPQGKIFNSNSWQLMALLESFGAVPKYYGIASDSPDATEKIMKSAVAENHVVLLSGGVSEGDFDFVPEIMKKLGFEILFDRVAVQPGKPTTFAVGSKYIFGLPGNPVSAYVQTMLLVFPLLEEMQGRKYTEPFFELPLAENYKRKNSERTAHIPVKISGDGRCSLVNYNGSAHISALCRADALMRIPVGVQSIAAGEKVKIILLPKA